MQVNTEQTEVVFRVWKSNPKTVIALFPYEKSGHTMCSSYEHVGQHGSADYTRCIERTRPAKPEEYEELKKELEAIGYTLHTIKRAGHKRIEAQQ